VDNEFYFCKELDLYNGDVYKRQQLPIFLRQLRISS